MSSHFKYEIDERNLRLQLKENELSFTEEAWQKFEGFAATNKSTNNEAIIKRFHVSLNRNVVLPAVFAVVIIMFSLLLFNFINIKNPNKESAAVTPQQAQIPKTEVKKPVTPPAQAIPAPAEIKDSVATETASIDNTATATEKQVSNVAVNETPLLEKTKRTESETQKAAAVVSDNSSGVTSTNSGEVTVKKKRRNKREMMVTEPTQEEAEQSPPPASPSSSEETPQ